MTHSDLLAAYHRTNLILIGVTFDKAKNTRMFRICLEQMVKTHKGQVAPV